MNRPHNVICLRRQKSEKLVIALDRIGFRAANPGWSQNPPKPKLKLRLYGRSAVTNLPRQVGSELQIFYYNSPVQSDCPAQIFSANLIE